MRSANDKEFLSLLYLCVFWYEFTTLVNFLALLRYAYNVAISQSYRDNVIEPKSQPN